MNLADVIQYDSLFPVRLKRPVKTAAGIELAECGVVFYMQSMQSKDVVSVERKHMQASMIAKQARGPNADHDYVAESEESELEKLIAAIGKWDWGGNGFDELGDDPDCTYENKRYVLTHPRAKWIVDQATAGAYDIGNFIQA